MKCSKRMCLIGAGVGLAVACAVAKARNRESDQSERPTKWDKMRQRMDEMPEDFPPRVMFDNAAAARANTEEILELLKQREGDGADEA